MAQGTVKTTGKKSTAKAIHSKKQASRVSKPKKGATTSGDKVRRKFTAGMAAKTEQLLGERAGHLELIGKGKKGKKETKKGGSKKFG
ncbi:hypothetical protein NLU13_7462 [Sarocladium strictum]|uniref:Uncharacterized protein n=1 Tax=Sarocladium strictum TaxID=5046 RepID=A0AA39GEB9_SARSR|nr:hypothetical protein NLU13_7462 [Sarocladium strictum]